MKKTLFLSFSIILGIFLLGFLSAYHCGDKIKNGNEECDYGSLNGFLCWASYGTSCNYCTSTCELKTITNYCGDGIKQICEECDRNSQSCTTTQGYLGTQPCNVQCSGWNTCTSTQHCGDGSINGNEQCDDENLMNGDGCSSNCTIEQPQQNETEENDTNNFPPQNLTNLTFHTTKIDWSKFCEPNWRCTGWNECNENEFMTRKCYDRNNCEQQYNKPTERAGCELQKALVKGNEQINPSLLMLLIMSGMSLGLFLILIILFFYKKK
jgi:cysteine-rich repeat protein